MRQPHHSFLFAGGGGRVAPEPRKLGCEREALSPLLVADHARVSGARAFIGLLRRGERPQAVVPSTPFLWRVRAGIQPA